MQSGITGGNHNSTCGQFHESVNLGVKILKWPDSHFHILIS